MLALIMGSSSCKKIITMTPPKAEKIEKTLSLHGHTRIDPYFWLNERENPAVLDYLKKENEYTDFMMKDTKELQEKLYNEIIGRIKQTDMSVPYKDNGYYYYTRYEEGKEYPVYCRKRDNLEAPEEVLLNVNEMAEGYDYYQVGGLSVSPDNKLLAFGVDTVSRRLYTLRIKNLETGEYLPDEICNTMGSPTWAADNKTLFYALKDVTTLRPYRIMRHALGMAGEKDVSVFEEEDETYSAYVYKTKSKEYVIIALVSTLSNEYRFLKADDPSGSFRLFHPRERELEYDIDHFEDRFYIRTNLEAKNFRLMETPVNNTSKNAWKEVIPHRDTVLLENFELFKDYMVLDERINGLTRFRVINMHKNSEYYIDMGEQAYTAWFSANPEFKTDQLRFGYSSMTTPTSTFDFSMKTKERTLLKQQEVVGGFNPEDYYAERLFATATDGSKIPISLVYRKGTKKDGSNPLFLYGYGSYGNTTDPYFSSVRLSLLDRGFIYAIAHVRGGQIMGRDWYEDGKLLKKTNTFTDFIACAEFLIKGGYTSEEKIMAYGGSAGGLLIGAVVNIRPDLFKGVIAAVPFVDVVTTMLDESIPLTTSEYDEWGNPNEKEYYDYMLSYSPYDNVEKKDYPNMLVTTGLHDSQVQYWEPAKWVAKLRDMKKDDNMLLLYTNMETGHSGASGRFEAHRETALEYAFLLKLMGIKE
ncbi:MAG: S9 family peptidase [Bacteroidales bacterium]|nr:S9 family peptidase [Bacteroidales bacterium]MBN2761742.1 S9 family peptidase [Bacteroidales bacterium]